ncbi:MAG: hypothetical protein CSA42_05850 [Gammaproteobacteria bacterium]|nr:MAG: hypothetical protein CSA42_05850 [Gammaproteobacteria bacterium]
MNNNNYIHNALTFKRPFVQDLAFALVCPNAIKNWQNQTVDKNKQQDINIHSPKFWQQQFTNYQARLKQLDYTNEYQTLTKFLMRCASPHRLGFHFESLMLFWLKDGFALKLHPFEVIAHNVQISKNGQTFSELDFIIFNHHTNLVEHWELAIKFYLGHPPFEPINWIGINSEDNLQRKIDHMTTKPFSINKIETNHHQGLPKNKLLKIDKRYAIIKGRFFKPYTKNESDFTHPTWLTDSFPLHTWYTLAQFQNLISNQFVRSHTISSGLLSVIFIMIKKTCSSVQIQYITQVYILWIAVLITSCAI